MRFLLLLLFPSLILSAPLQVPSASGGIIDKEIEEQYETEEISPDKQMPMVEIDIPDRPLDISSEKKVFIQKIVLHGNEIFSCQNLAAIVSPYEDREMSIKDINDLCRKIQIAYAKKGYFLVRVYAPAQEIREATLRIEVLEAKLGVIEVVGNNHYKTKFILSYFERFLGKTMNYDDLLKTLLLINENEDLQVGSIFQKGREVGTVDMVLRVQDADPLHLSLDVNNYGSKVTSLYRSGLRGDIGNVITDGDRFSLIGVIGYPFRRLRFIDGIYSFPLNRRGSELEFSFLFSDFQVGEKSLRPLHIHGTTQVAATKYTQALHRTGKLSTDLYAGFEYKQIKNFANHTISAYDKLRVASFGYKIDYMDACKGRNVADIALFQGIPNFLGGLPAVDTSEETSRTHAGGRFTYIDGNYQRIQRVFSSSFVFVNFQGQFSFYKLPLSEQFYIGGMNSVRGYKLASALGDSGICVNAEYRFPPFFLGSTHVPFTQKMWRDVVQLVGFVDHGEVYVMGGGINSQNNQNGSSKTVAQNTRIYLTSAGLGLRIFGPYKIDCSADVGFPLVDYGQTKKGSATFYFRVNMRFL
jgi:hemolysin activation/secretion protein